jgi:predicted dehydrogenase
MNRRTFFLAGGGMAMASAQMAGQQSSVRIGLIGSGGRGRYLNRQVSRDPGVEIRAVCDVYEPNLEKGLSEAKGETQAYRDYRELLADDTIDAVIIATPEHWHHRMFLDALAARKDIYIEKPLCQKPEQGVEMMDAAARTSQVIQVGTQRRSYDLYQKARDLIAAGELGAVRMVRSHWLNSNVRPPRGELAGRLDWEQWQGPAENRDLDAKRFFHWRSYSDYSGGIMADQGAHVFDGINMLMGAGFVKAVNASANATQRPGVDTPETVVVAAEFPEEFLAVFSINYAAMRYKRENDQLNSFDGDAARMDIGREKLEIFRRGAEETVAIRETSDNFDRSSQQHVENWLHCIRTREQPTATVEGAFQAALITQMANLSLQHGKRIRWNADPRAVEI